MDIELVKQDFLDQFESRTLFTKKVHLLIEELLSRNGINSSPTIPEFKKVTKILGYKMTKGGFGGTLVFLLVTMQVAGMTKIEQLDNLIKQELEADAASLRTVSQKAKGQAKALTFTITSLLRLIIVLSLNPNQALKWLEIASFRKETNDIVRDLLQKKVDSSSVRIAGPDEISS